MAKPYNKNKLKVGNRVLIDKKEVLSMVGILPIWYSDDSYIIMEIDTSDIAYLNKRLPQSTNEIHTSNLKLDIKTERKLKLDKIIGK